MKKITALFVASTLALGAANLAHAADATATSTDNAPMMHHKRGPGGPHEMMFKGLNLTDAQKTQMRDIMKESHKDMQRPSLDERRAAHSIIASDSFDQSKAEAQAEKMSANAKEHALKMLETQNKLYNVLTPEQKKQYNANFEKRLTEKGPHEGKMAPPAEPAE